MFKRRKKKGQAIVEMALVFPFFLLIVVGGIIDFGFAFYNFLTLQQIANDTAQWAAEKHKEETAGEILDYGNALRPTWWDAASYIVQAPTWSDLTTGGRSVSIIVTFNSPAYTPFYQTMFQATTGNTGINLAAQASYKIPQYVTDH
ncbi:MAG: pilus assembly protein [Candidatus Riflebacteria bacterium]|nr:pilus assembly protein [Candidatus Riflebacteria bacterium]